MRDARGEGDPRAALGAQRVGTIIGADGRYELGLADIRPGVAGASHNGTFLVLLHVMP